MPLFSRKRSEAPSRGSGGRSAGILVYPSLPDAEWCTKSEAAYETTVSGYYGSPETMAEGGKVNYGLTNFGVALFFYQKSIDMLHTQYLFMEMRCRQPSPADVWIVEGYVNSLGASLSMHPTAPVAESVREVTHRLRTISSACQRFGIPDGLYMGALETMARDAPDVNVDDIFW